MAGGPYYAFSEYPNTSGVAYENVFDGGGATNDKENMRFLASASQIGADAVAWVLKFTVPSVLPTGTPNLRIRSRANATTGVIGLNIRWSTSGPNGSPQTSTLNNEGAVDITVPGTANDNKTTDVPLDVATAPAAGDHLLVHVEVVDSAFTLAVESGHEFTLVYV